LRASEFIEAVSGITVQVREENGVQTIHAMLGKLTKRLLSERLPHICNGKFIGSQDNQSASQSRETAMRLRAD
jgi:hypothetical protein